MRGCFLYIYIYITVRILKFLLLYSKIYLFPKERFWRIPGKLKVDDLRSRAAALAPPSEDAEKSPSTGDRYAVLKALVKKKKENTASEKRKRYI